MRQTCDLHELTYKAHSGIPANESDGKKMRGAVRRGEGGGTREKLVTASTIGSLKKAQQAVPSSSSVTAVLAIWSRVGGGRLPPSSSPSLDDLPSAASSSPLSSSVLPVPATLPRQTPSDDHPAAACLFMSGGNTQLCRGQYIPEDPAGLQGDSTGEQSADVRPVLVGRARHQPAQE